MAALRVISADSHMMEPADLWTARLDKKFRDQAPQVVKNEGKPGYSFVAPGINPFGGGWICSRPQREGSQRAYGQGIRGCPAQRLGPGGAHQRPGR